MTTPTPAQQAQQRQQWVAAVAAYRAGQDTINQAFATLGVQVLRAVPVLNPQTIGTLAAAFAPLMGTYRHAGYTLMTTMYHRVRPPDLPPVTLPDAPLFLPPSAVQESLTRTLAAEVRRAAPSPGEKRPARRQPEPNTVAIAVADLVRQVEDAPRQGLINAVNTDDHAVQWARYDTAGDPCAFCTTLISRGPVYSAETVGFTAHPNDRCIGVPVFPGYRSSPMWEQAQQALDVYTSAQKDRKDGQTAINAVRTHLYAQDQHPLAGTGIAPGGTQ